MLSIIYRCIISPLPNEINLIYATNNINQPDNGNWAANATTSLQVLIPFAVQANNSFVVKTRS